MDYQLSKWFSHNNVFVLFNKPKKIIQKIEFDIQENAKNKITFIPDVDFVTSVKKNMEKINKLKYNR